MLQLRSLSAKDTPYLRISPTPNQKPSCPVLSPDPQDFVPAATRGLPAVTNHRLRGAFACAGHRPAGTDPHGPGRPRPAPHRCRALGLGCPGILSPRRRRQPGLDNPKLQAGTGAGCTEDVPAWATEHQVRTHFSVNKRARSEVLSPVNTASLPWGRVGPAHRGPFWEV